jgi:segregation and condensation protein A
MPEYRVELDAYSGPLDLLLYLIRRDEVDINDIPIAPIAEQYLQYLQTLKTLDINVAAEFLVMAATLMEIKSAMLMPREQAEQTELLPAEDPTDPRYELIQQLLAYKRYKDAASQLDHRRQQFDARFARQPARITEQDDQQVELELEDVSLWDLVEAFGRIMDQTGGVPPTHDVVDDDTPIELHIADIVDRLEREGPMTLHAIFEGRTRGAMIGLFLATLELLRQYRLKLRQDDPAEPIHIELRDADEVAEIERAATRDDQADRPTDPQDADAFDWPDEQEKQRYVRRQERRARGESVEEDEQLAQDIAELEAAESHTGGPEDADAAKTDNRDTTDTSATSKDDEP